MLISRTKFDCDGNCLVETDCAGVCGGDAAVDECGECGGDGIDEGFCDCDGNVDLGCGCGEMQLNKILIVMEIV